MRCLSPFFNRLIRYSLSRKPEFEYCQRTEPWQVGTPPGERGERRWIMTMATQRALHVSSETTDRTIRFIEAVRQQSGTVREPNATQN